MADDPVADLFVEAAQRQSGASVEAPLEPESGGAEEEILVAIDGEDSEKCQEEEGGNKEGLGSVAEDESAIVEDEDERRVSEPNEEEPNDPELEDRGEDAANVASEKASTTSTSKGESTAPNDDNDAATMNSLPFPLTRVRNIVKLDKEIKLVARPALVAITHAAEQFVKSLTSTAFSEMLKGKRKSLRLSHLESAVKRRREFLDFLDDSMDIFAEKKEVTDEEEEEEDDDSKVKKLDNHPLPPGTRCITDFFGTVASGGEPPGSSSTNHQQQEQID